MVKTSSRKQRGLGVVRKHLIRLMNTHGDDDSGRKPSTLSNWLKKLPALAKTHWNLLLRTCSTWSFIPVESDPGTGWTKLSSIWKRCIHYVLVSIYGLLMSYRFYVTLQRLAEGKLDLLTYMCACSFTELVIATAASLGTTWSPQALCDLFNSWKSIENAMVVQTGRRKTALDDIDTSMKVILLAIVIHLAAVNASMFSLVGEVPTSVITTLKTTGWLELPDSLPPILWSLVFLPLELLTLWPPMLITGVVASSVALGLGALKIFAEQARKTQVVNMEDWMKVYRLRQTLQVSNIILMDWGSGAATMLLVSASCGVILLLYVTIRPSDLPLLVYIWFPIVAVAIMVALTWLCYDGVNIKRAAQDLEGNLELGLNRWRFRNMKMRRNTVHSRMLRSLRPMFLRLGPFADISLDVPVNVWDEVLNQLLFLLSF